MLFGCTSLQHEGLRAKVASPRMSKALRNFHLLSEDGRPQDQSLSLEDLPTSLLSNWHSLTTLYPRAMQHIPLCFHPCCVPVLPCDQTVSLLQLGLVTQVIWVMLLLSLQLLCGVGQHPLLSSTMSMLPRECRCCVGLLLADEYWLEEKW